MSNDTAASPASLPTREDTDRLAAQLPADRTGWDGKPLSEVDQRLYALCESGYDGWIDQDGYPAEDADLSDDAS